MISLHLFTQGKTCLLLFQSFFAERFFSLFDTDKSGSIECSELIDGLRMLTKGTSAQKLKFLFNVYDIDGSYENTIHVLYLQHQKNSSVRIIILGYHLI